MTRILWSTIYTQPLDSITSIPIILPNRNLGSNPSPSSGIDGPDRPPPHPRSATAVPPSGHSGPSSEPHKSMLDSALFQSETRYTMWETLRICGSGTHHESCMQKLCSPHKMSLRRAKPPVSDTPHPTDTPSSPRVRKTSPFLGDSTRPRIQEQSTGATRFYHRRSLRHASPSLLVVGGVGAASVWWWAGVWSHRII
jgi:hypothetical protein